MTIEKGFADLQRIMELQARAPKDLAQHYNKIAKISLSLYNLEFDIEKKTLWNFFYLRRKKRLISKICKRK